MDEMTAFEHQLTAELDQMAGPGRRIDGVAMVQTLSTQSSKWRWQSMFSATKFVVAGAIVALFGGLLLAGVLTTQDGDGPVLPPGASQSAEASMEASLLPGVDLEAEEVGPGVFRVLSDGSHDLSAIGEEASDEPGLESPETGDVAVMPGGDVWVVRQERIPWSTGVPERWENDLIRVGDPEIVLAGFPGFEWHIGSTDDGSLTLSGWSDDGESWARVLRDGTWTDHLGPEADHPCADLRFPQADSLIVGDQCWFNGLDRGAIWNYRAGSDGDHERVLATEVGLTEDVTVEWLVAAGDGSGWASVHRPHESRPTEFEGLVHYDGTDWSFVPYEQAGTGVASADQPVLEGNHPWVLSVGPDGSVWVGFIAGDEAGRLTVGRWDGESWSTYGPVDVGPEHYEADQTTHFPSDGSVWFLGGLAMFDGNELRSLDLPISGRLASEPGSHVLWATDAGRLYVIDPQAAAE